LQALNEVKISNEFVAKKSLKISSINWLLYKNLTNPHFYLVLLLENSAPFDISCSISLSETNIRIIKGISK